MRIDNNLNTMLATQLQVSEMASNLSEISAVVEILKCKKSQQI